MPPRRAYCPGVERRVYVRKRWGRWWWYCNLCYPMARGSTMTFEKTMKNVENHCRHLRDHHAWVSRSRDGL